LSTTKKFKGKAADGDQIALQFPNNVSVSKISGEHQKNLVVIEQRLEVRIAQKGNVFSITGAPLARERAAAVLRILYERAEGVKSISSAEVEAEIRFVLDEPAEPAQRGSGLPSIKTAASRVTRARSPAQAAYLDLMRTHPLVFGIGPAGTGKTYLAAAYGAHLLYERKVERLVLSRPAMEAGERLGFLPGDLKEKIDPYLRPLYDALFDTIGDRATRLMETGVIEVAPLAFMRGRTLANAFVILDEAQNCTSAQMKMFLTRLGEDSRMVVTGDASQSDLPGGRAEGLNEALTILSGVEGVATAHFSDKDVVRHPLVGRIVRAYDNQARGGFLPARYRKDSGEE
jgi:phosphate starvation-inducible PhoH-like protein